MLANAPQTAPNRRKEVAARIFALLEQAAVESRRCPTNAQISSSLIASGYKIAAGSIPEYLAALVRERFIVILKYGKNWRDVKICTGPHKGKKTKPPINGSAPYLILDDVERAVRDRRQKRQMNGRRRTTFL